MPPISKPLVVAGFRLPGEVDDLGKPLQREVLALDRDEDLGCRGERRAGELTERGRAVEEDEFIMLSSPLSCWRKLERAGGSTPRARRRQRD